jgi:hypothetical protein
MAVSRYAKVRSVPIAWAVTTRVTREGTYTSVG